MSKNSSRTQQWAVRLLDDILREDAANPHAFKGSAVGHLKAARKEMLEDIRKRRDGRAREAFRRGGSDV